MSATRIDGKAVAAARRAETARAVAAFRAAGGPQPGLTVVLVGENAASQVYVRAKGKATREAGMASTEHRMPASASEADILAIVARLNADPTVHGILVQLPLPAGVRADAVLRAIDPAKDVDGFHPINAGLLATGQPALAPCTPLGCVILAESAIGSLSGVDAVIVGRSNIVGKPLAQLLLAKDATVTIAHSRSRDLPSLCRRADLLIAAVGRPEMIGAEWVKPGACVIDVGINRLDDGRLVGDVDFAAVAEVAGSITPVPGGVGPMTIACLLENTLAAARAQTTRVG